MRGILRVRERIPSRLMCRRSSPFGRYSSPQLWTAPHSAIRRFTSDKSAGPFPDINFSRTRRYVSEFDHGTTPRISDEVSKTPELESDHVDFAALQAEFYSILGEGQPDLVMAAMLDPRFAELVRLMPQSAFVEAFHLLSPAYFIESYKKIHRSLHPFTVYTKNHRSLLSIFAEFANNLADVILTRGSADHVLGLAEYTHLLDCARSMGDAVMADHIWHMMEDDGIVPDVQCYNYYMEAKVWDFAWVGRERYRIRMTPYVYRKRRFHSPPDPGWQGYRTAERSVRKEVLRIFDNMIDEGNYGDQASFVNVILASSRVGHVDGMKNVLKTVWNVDVDALKEQVDEASIPEVLEYDRSSPMYPNGFLLLAIAHAFGANNDIPAALRAIEFISNSYDIPIPDAVWYELFERSFILSRPRFGEDAWRNAKGKVSYKFLDSLFQIMTSEPFNVRPTIEMHRMLAKTAWDRDILKDFKYHMDAAYDILKETRRESMAARSIVESYLTQSLGPDLEFDPVILQSRAFSDAVHTYDILRLRVAQQALTLERLARLLLIHRRWVGRDCRDWERRLLPSALEEWRDFLPQNLSYWTVGGVVTFRGKTHWGDPRLMLHYGVPVRQPTAENGLGVDKEVMEIEDNIFWEDYREAYPQLDLTFPALKRLFRAYDENNEYAEDLPDDLEDDPSTSSRPYPTPGPRLQDREEEYDPPFNHFPGGYSVAR